MLQTIPFLFSLLVAGSFQVTGAQQAAGVTGIVMDGRQEPLTQVPVVVSADDVEKGRSRTGMDGKYSFRPLPSGQYTVSFFHRDRTVIFQDVPVTEGGLTIVNDGEDPAMHPEEGSVIRRRYPKLVLNPNNKYNR